MTPDEIMSRFTPQAKQRTSAENVADVLAALTATTNEAAAQAPDQDEAIRIWHKHCDAFASKLGVFGKNIAVDPPSCVIKAMLEFAALSRPVVEQPIPATQPVQAQGDRWGAKGVVHDYDPEVDGSTFYDLESVDNAVHAVTHDEGEDDSVTVLERVALALENRFGGASIWEVFDRLEAATAPAVDRGLSEALRQIVRQHELQVHIAAYGYSKCVREMAELAEIKGEPHEIAAAALAASAPSQAEPVAPEPGDGRRTTPADERTFSRSSDGPGAAEQPTSALVANCAGQTEPRCSSGADDTAALAASAPSQAEPMGPASTEDMRVYDNIASGYFKDAPSQAELVQVPSGQFEANGDHVMVDAPSQAGSCQASGDWATVEVNQGFPALMESLERAARKGYMPDSMTAEWEAFEYRLPFSGEVAAQPAGRTLTADPLWPVDGLYSDMEPPATHRDRWMFNQGRLAEARITAGKVEQACAAIKAADDKSTDEAGYMLDSNDCIKIVRDQFAASSTTAGGRDHG